MPNPKFTTHSLYDWLRAEVATRNDDQCWLWPYTKTRGYGHIKINGKLSYVHRVAFFLCHGRWPLPFALHRCDERACFNPTHLFEGNNAANVADMVSKQRQRGPMGEKNSHVVLTAAMVREIRTLYAAGMPMRELTAKYRVQRCTIRKAALGISWKHLI